MTHLTKDIKFWREHVKYWQDSIERNKKLKFTFGVKMAKRGLRIATTQLSLYESVEAKEARQSQ